MIARDAASAVGGVALAVVAGVYLVAVVREVTARVIARRPVPPGEVVLAPVARTAAMLLQSRRVTERPDAPGSALAPALLAAAGATSLSAIPLARGVAAADAPDGIALYGAAVAMVLVAVFLHGWSANSPFPLLGAYRFAAAGLSYPIPFILVLIAAALQARSLSLGQIVASQSGLWNVVRQPLGLPVFLVAGWGLAFSGPFSFADATDLAGGTAAEASGPALVVWQAARASLLVSVAATGAAAFLGGWHGPVLPGAVWMIAKTVVLLVLLVVVGELLGRVRLEEFVTFAWVVLIPLALVDVFASGAIAL